MANLARSGVTENASYEAFGLNSKRYAVFELTIVLTTMGSATNKILASVLHLSKIKGCSDACSDGDDVILPAVPSTDGSMILLGGGASNAPADYTDTFNITVWGDPMNISL